MKTKLVTALMLVGLLFSAMACTVQGAKDATVPNNDVSPAPIKYLIIVSAGDFTKVANINKQVEVKAGDVFTIALDSNATTGFQWTEQAKIADTGVLTQESHAFNSPITGDTPMVGAAGLEEWTFIAGQAGTTTVTTSYDRPWAGGEKGVRTFELTVIVK